MYSIDTVLKERMLVAYFARIYPDAPLSRWATEDIEAEFILDEYDVISVNYKFTELDGLENEEECLFLTENLDIQDEINNETLSYRLPVNDLYIRRGTL